MRDLRPFWSLLEANLTLGGPRKHLAGLLGSDLVVGLEHIGVLRCERIAEEYPCTQPGGDDCPMLIDRSEDTIRAICGNDPPQCQDLILTSDDIVVLVMDWHELLTRVASALQVRPNVEALPGARSVYRIGTFIPEPGVRQPIFFVARCGKTEYGEALDVLRSRQAGAAFAVLVPTERFLAEDIIQRMANQGIPILGLEDAIGWQEGMMVVSVDPLLFFAGIGRRGSGRSLASCEIMAQAVVSDGSGRHRWVDLDEQGYNQLVAAAKEYEIFADELTRMVRHARKRSGNPIRASYFYVLRACTEKHGFFDPVADERFDQLNDPKQTFVRARQAIDAKVIRGDGKEDWMLFKTCMVDKSARYRFAPEPTARFALIFQPMS
jgi:hypothetical protein